MIALIRPRIRQTIRPFIFCRIRVACGDLVHVAEYPALIGAGKAWFVYP